MKWDRDALKALWDKGLSFTQLALHFGVKRNVIAGRLHRMKKQGTGLAYHGKGHNHYKSKPIAVGVPSPPRAPGNRSKVAATNGVGAAPPVPPLHVGILDLKHDQCRFAFGEAPKFTFCGLPCEPHQSYCTEHKKRVYKEWTSSQGNPYTTIWH